MNGTWRIFLAISVFSAIFFGCSPKQSDIIIAEVGNKQVNLGEFERFYARQRGGLDVAPDSMIERERFLDLLTNYRLKLQDAYDRNLQNDPELISELADYRASLAATFLIDKEINDPGIQQLYDRRKEELRAKHILIALRQDATPDDTLKAFKRAMDIIERIKTGESFDSIAFKESEDPSAKSNYGDIYFFTAGQMTPSFENAAYAMKKGELTLHPVRSPFGYHVIMLTDRQAARGQYKVRHIMVRFASQADSDTVAAYKRIAELLDSVKNGAENDSVKVKSLRERLSGSALQDSLRAISSFDRLAIKYSEDGGSAPNGGDLGWFERRKWVQPFDEAAFRLQAGLNSPIIRTPYGYHIIHCDSVKALPPFTDPELKEDLKKVFLQYRYNDDFATYVDAMKKEYRYTFNDSLFNAMAEKLDSNKTIEDTDWVPTIPADEKRQTLYTLNGKSFSLDSAINTLIKKPEYKNTSLRTGELKSRFERIGEGFLFGEKAIGLEQRYPDFAAMMKEYEDGIVLFKAEQLEVWNKVAITDTALHAFYEAHPGKFKTAPRVNFAEIHVASDTLALVLYDSLTHGADFGALADRYNDDPDLKAKHGEHGFVAATDPLSNLAESLAIGEISQPPYELLENGGFSIIKVIAKEGARDKTFDEAGAELSNALQEAESKRLETDWLERLKVKYPVKQYKERLGAVSADSKSSQ